MGADWMRDVREKSRKKRQMLFSRDSACLQGLLELMGLQKHRTLVLWAFRCVERPLSILRARSKCTWPGAPCFRCTGWPEK